MANNLPKRSTLEKWKSDSNGLISVRIVYTVKFVQNGNRSCLFVETSAMLL